MTFVGLSCRSDDRLWETLVLLHSFRKFHATKFTAAFFIGTPSRTSEDRTDNHFYTEPFAFKTNCNHWVWSCEFPVRTDVGSCVKELGGNLIQYLSFEGYAFRQYNVECRDSVGCNHYDNIVVDVVHIAYLAMIHAFLSFKMKISFCKCFHILFLFVYEFSLVVS